MEALGCYSAYDGLHVHQEVEMLSGGIIDWSVMQGGVAELC